MKNIKTVLHYYRLNASEEYYALCDELKSLGLKKFSTTDIPGKKDTEYWEAMKALNGKEVELETNFLFEDQWNTAPIPGLSDSGFRVFDWKEPIYSNRSLKVGYWLEQTEDMREIRENALKCGYCGHLERIEYGNTFCGRCLDSEYLQENDLKLLRLLPVSKSFNGKRPELTKKEKAFLLPRFKKAQIHGCTERGKARVEQRIKDIKERVDKKIKNAENERDGFLWCTERGINTDNMIYYDHTGKFSYGWRKSVINNSLFNDIKKQFADFPFDIEFK